MLMPVFARDIFKGGAHTMGFFMTMAGLGALGGAMFLAARKSVLGLPRIIAWTAVLFGTMIVIFSFSRVFWFAMPVILVSGFGIMVNMAACNTILQTVVDEDKRGRVMAFYTFMVLGMAPFGAFQAGWVAHQAGAPVAAAVGGAVCAISSLVLWRLVPEVPALR